MRVRTYLSLTLLGAAIGLAAVWWLEDSGAPPQALVTQPAAPSTTAASVPPLRDEAALEEAAAQAMETPQGREFARRMTFQADYRNFLQQASTLSDAERQAQAEALVAEIDRREAEDELSLNEALLMQLGMVKVSYADEAQQAAAVDRLMARYRQRSADREAQRQPDERFAAYKQDEARIVAEVMAMTSIPGGLSRDEYLRERLQQAREQAYR